MADPSSIEAIASELYALPRGEFVAARTARAKELRAADLALADQVKALAKPSLVAWAVDAAVHAKPKVAAQLVDVVAKMQAGSGDVRAQGAKHDALVGELVAAAKAALRDAGEGASADRMSQVSSAIRAAALASDTSAFVDGRLDREPKAGEDTLEAALLAGLAAGPARRRAAPAADEADEADETDEDAAYDTDHSADAANAATDDDGAAEAAAAAEREAATKRRDEQRRLRSQLKDAKADERDRAGVLREAERDVHRLQRELRAAEHARDDAAAHAERATALVDELEAALADLAD
ncbi:MAG: hypothetical protein JWM98_1707 [Thermoleophilia bacterium]|nr:hypothetical protein [Thermoleophilia bacterium]